MMRRAFSVYRSNMSPLPPSSPVSCRVSDTPHTLGNPLGPHIIMQSRYQRTQVPKGTPVHDTPVSDCRFSATCRWHSYSDRSLEIVSLCCPLCVRGSPRILRTAKLLFDLKQAVVLGNSFSTRD